MFHPFGLQGPDDPMPDPKRVTPEPTGAWMVLALGFTALISLAATSASELVLVLVALAVASVATCIARHG
jgi:hypothetical protein